MARYEFKLPDIGEGIAEAEIVAWHVKVGDTVAEDQQLADMMTDKATVEMEIARSPARCSRWPAKSATRSRSARCWSVFETEGADRAAEPAADSRGRTPARRRRGRGRRRRRREDIAGRRRRPRRSEDDAAQPREARALAAAAASASRQLVADKPPPQRARAHVLASPAVRAARPRPRHRPRAGEDRRRPHPPRRSRRLSPLQRRHRVRPARRATRGRRDDQGRRPAPQDRREHAGGEAPHPAFHPGRGISTSPRSRRRAR